MINSIKQSLGNSTRLNALSDKAKSELQNVVSVSDIDEVWEIVRLKRHRVMEWIGRSGMELLSDTFTRHSSDQLARFIRDLIPFPLRLLIKEAILAELLWTHREKLASLLQEASAQHV